MTRPSRFVACASVALTALGASGEILAQPSRTNIATVADSIAAVGDSSRAYALLDSATKADKKDGAAWHRLGLLSWNMAKGKRTGGYISDQRTIRLLLVADSALRLATKVSPDSARYWLDLGRFNLGSSYAATRFAASGQVSNALEAATKSGDPTLLALAADEVGMATWRRYEPIANRALLSDGQQKIQLSTFNTFSRDKARDFVETFVNKIQPPTGDADYRQAFASFEQAVAAGPSSQLYSRHLYMAYGERGRWSEMLDVASRRASAYPLDFQAQLARGLALHRLANDKAAQVAFDSAFALMDENESRRMTRFTRILRPRPTKATKGTIGDTLSFSKLPAAQQRGLEQMYWFMNDPLTLTNENEFRLEFLSRVVWADFRWTVDDRNLRGADTDRGDIYVRYGPPDMDLTVPGSSGNTATNTDGGVTLVWGYNNGLVFFFDLAPGFLTGRFAFVDRDNVDQMKSDFPVSFANVASTRMIDTIPIRVARFRAGADSTDAVIASLIPMDSLVRGLDVTSAPVDVDFRIFDQFVRVKGVESEQQDVRPDSTRGPQPRRWVRRLGPGVNVIRVEALQADSRRAARAMTRINPESTVGFGMSDILLGNKPTARDGVAPKRWSDVAVVPSQGTYERGAAVGMVWEMYDLVAREGSSKYRLAVEVQRADRSTLGSFAARVVDRLGQTVGREQTSRDKIVIGFDRTAAAAATIVEFFSLDLSEQSSGRYRLRVEITDLGNGKKTSRSTEFTIR